MNPEISRRCSSCGASIRERGAMFCPECGKPLPTISLASEEPQAPAPDEIVNSTPTDSVMNATETGESVTASQAGESTDAENSSETESASEQTAPSSSENERPGQPMQPVAASEKRESSIQGGLVKHQPNIARRAHSGVAERTRETFHRASTVARSVIEDEVKRVEKIRQVSSVVIEEASYDPSLRFVLVALVLFIIFIILLVLSKVMG